MATVNKNGGTVGRRWRTFSTPFPGWGTVDKELSQQALTFVTSLAEAGNDGCVSLGMIAKIRQFGAACYRAGYYRGKRYGTASQKGGAETPEVAKP